MKNLIKLFFTLVLMASTTSIFSQHTVSAAGQLGWAIPGGGGVGETEAYDVDGGLVWGADVLYHLGEGNLRVGIGYNAAILASVSGTLSAYGMTVGGAKGLYYLKTEGFSPYAGLTLGFSKLETPETSVNGTVTNPSEVGYGLGVMPTVGLDFGGFFISADYVLPLNIALKDDALEREGSIGYLGINLGYRYTFDF